MSMTKAERKFIEVKSRVQIQSEDILNIQFRDV